MRYLEKIATKSEETTRNARRFEVGFRRRLGGGEEHAASSTGFLSSSCSAECGRHAREEMTPRRRNAGRPRP